MVKFGFDLGSFLGGAVGTIGAFLAALITIRHQTKREMPKIRKSIYQCAANVWSILEEFSFSLMFEAGTHDEVVKLATDARSNLEKLIPAAIESDDRIVQLINKARGDIGDVCKKHREKADNFSAFEKDMQDVLEINIKNIKQIMDEALQGRR